MVTAQAQGVPVEDVSQRTESTQTFANPDGTWSTEMATGPVRVQRENGSWVDIDTTLVQNASGEWAPRASAADVSFSDGGAEPFATMAPTEGSSFGLTWPEPLPAPVVAGSTLTYSDVVPNGDLVVQALPGGFSHEIVLRQAPAEPVEYPIPLELDGLTLVEEANGTISVQTTAGNQVASAPAPLMWDHEDGPAGEPEHVAPLTTTVDGTGADAELVLTPDMGMLTDPDTQYPVTLDPTFNRQAYRDVWVQNADYTTGQVGSPELRVGTYDGGTHKARSFIDFNTDTLVGKQILDATLKLRNFDSGGCGGNRIRVHAISQTWDKDTLTWANQPDFHNAVYDDYSTAYAGPTCPGAGWAQWNVQPIVERWADGRFDRNGFRIAAVEETLNGTWRRYRSANYATTTSYRPHLVVTYNNLPNTPGTPSISPVAGSTSTGLVTRDTTPTLSAKVTDPDGGKVRGFFEVRDSAGTLEWSGQSTLVASGSTASVTVPSSELAHGGTYTVKAFADDDTGRSKNASSTAVKVDTQAPAVPTVTASGVSNGGWHDPAPVSNTFTVSSTPGDVTSYSYAQDDDSWVTKTASSGGDATLSWSPANGAHKLRVKALDKAGNTSAIATFTFGVGGAELALPIDGERSTSTFDIDATAPEGATAARLQWRPAGADAAPGWNPATEVTHAGTGQPWLGTVTSSGGAANAEELVWEATAETSASALGLLDVRVCFDYFTGLEKCSPASQVQTVPHAFGSSFPTAPLGLGEVSLFTGELEVSETDVEVPAYTGTLSLGRSHLSYAGQPASPAARVFGPGWTADLAGPSTGLAGFTVLDRTAEDGSITLQAPWGESYVYQHSSGQRAAQQTGDYIGVGETASFEDQLTLAAAGTGSATHVLTLTEITGTTTTWQRTTAGVWELLSVTEPQQTGTTSYAYNADGLVSWIFAPAPPGVTCTEASQQPGCRALHFNYTTVGTASRLASVDLVIFDPKPEPTTGRATASQTAPLSHISVAKYSYTPEGLLAASWDPRLGDGDQALKTAYTYTAVGNRTRLATIAPPGQDAWAYSYDANGRATSVRRPQPNGSGTSTWTVGYDVPLSGSGLPDLRPAATATWGQNEADAPELAAAVWAPDRLPAATPTSEDYQHATLSYFTAVGRTTNLAGFGAGTWQIDTVWYDDHGNTTRSLTASNRNAALAEADSVTTAEELSSLTAYRGDGSRVEHMYGPAREVVLEDGSTMVGRDHTSYLYDNETTDPTLLAGQPTSPPPGGYDLVVEETLSVTDTDRTIDLDAHRVRYGYAPFVTGDGNGWTLGMPTTRKIQLEDVSWSVETTRYDVEGKVVETRQPGGGADSTGAGNDPKSHRIAYYTADDSAPHGDCDNRPQWAGLECFSGPAAQPTTGKPLPVTWTVGYDYMLNPTRVEDRSGTVTRTSVTRTDAAGRLTHNSLEVTNAPAGDVQARDVTITYHPDTGLPASQATGSDTTEFTHDSWGLRTRYATTTGALTNTATTTYDAVGRVKTFDDGKGTYTYTYEGTDANGLTENRGLLTAVDVGLPSSPDTFTAAYDADGSVDQMRYPNGTVATWDYNSNGDTVSLTYTHAGAELLGFSSDVDVDGRVRTSTGPESNQIYTYDNLSRLTKVEDTYRGVCETRVYGFDADSNRTDLTTYQPATDDTCSTAMIERQETSTFDDADRIIDPGYTYDELGRTRTVPAADTDQPTAGSLDVDYHANDMVASLSQAGIPDASGDLVTRTKSFTLDTFDRVRQVTDTEDGAETRRIVNHYADDSDSPAWISTSTDAGNTWTWDRNVTSPLGTLALIQNSQGNVELQLPNLHGDIAATMDNSEAAVGLTNTYDSTEYGEPRDPALTADRYGWLGAEQRSFDALGGVALMGARLYNPETGRFLSIDPVLGGNVNRWTYPADPVNSSDLSGEVCRCVRIPSFGWGPLTGVTARTAARRAIRFNRRGQTARANRYAASAVAKATRQAVRQFERQGYRTLTVAEENRWLFSKSNRMRGIARGHEIHRRTRDILRRAGVEYNTSRYPDYRFGNGLGVELKPWRRCRVIPGLCVEYRMPRRS